MRKSTGRWFMKRVILAVASASIGAVLLGAPSPRAGGAAGFDPDEALAANLALSRSSTPASDVPSPCPSNMVDVEGEYCPVVEQFCVRQVDPKHPERDRCAEFAPTGRCYGTPAHKHFCIDRYEWPNQAGVKPVVAVDWNEARAQCAGAGKRLCQDSEWTLACEGRERLPYPYGYERNVEACNIDRPYIVPDDAKWANLKTRPEEIARLDQRDASGTRESCISPYGVFDMTGNVDEWVSNEKGKEREKPYVSGLKGGYWGPVRDRCRPMTTDHNQWHTGYQIGFRCCADASAAPDPHLASGSPAPIQPAGS